MEILIKKNLKNKPPEISGRYLFLIEEQGDLGLSKFIWNCCFDKEKNIISDRGKYYTANYWYEPITIELDSEKILSIKDRASNEDLKYFLTIDNHSLIVKYHKALEAADLKVVKLIQEIEELESLLSSATTISLEEHGELCTKYAEISWNIEELANSRDSKDGISNELFRQLIRELLDKYAKERYNKAFEDATIQCCAGMVCIDFDTVNNLIKIAAYGTDK